jgi:formyltetrahydrofolate synthetase
MTEPSLQRRFCVHGVAESASRAHVIEGVSFEDAALHFVGDHHPVADADEEIALYVEDLETGERQCFRIDMETGETAPCD